MKRAICEPQPAAQRSKRQKRAGLTFKVGPNGVIENKSRTQRRSKSTGKVSSSPDSSVIPKHRTSETFVETDDEKPYRSRPLALDTPPTQTMSPVLGFDHLLDEKVGACTSTIYKSMCFREKLLFTPREPTAKYMKFRPTLVGAMRDFAEKHNLKDITLFIGIKYLDRILGSTAGSGFPRTFYQTVALVVLMLAAKFEEGDASVPHFMERLKALNDRRQGELPVVKDFEIFIIKKFKWELQESTILHFLDYYIAKGIIFEDDNFSRIRSMLTSGGKSGKDSKNYSSLNDYEWLHKSHKHKRAILRTVHNYVNYHVHANILEDEFLEWLPSVNAMAIVMAVRRDLGFYPWRKEFDHTAVYESACRVWTLHQKRNNNQIRRRLPPIKAPMEEDESPRSIGAIVDLDSTSPTKTKTNKKTKACLSDQETNRRLHQKDSTIYGQISLKSNEKYSHSNTNCSENSNNKRPNRKQSYSKVTSNSSGVVVEPNAVTTTASVKSRQRQRCIPQDSRRAVYKSRRKSRGLLMMQISKRSRGKGR